MAEELGKRGTFYFIDLRVIAANPGEGRGRAGIQLPERGQATFLEDEKVASPHLDSRP